MKTFKCTLFYVDSVVGTAEVDINVSAKSIDRAHDALDAYAERHNLTVLATTAHEV